MKNSFQKSLLILFILNLINFNAFSQEQFNFDITEMQILEEGNLFVGDKKGVITTDNKIIINSNRFEYDKKMNVLKTFGQSKLNDLNNKIIITADKSTYYKNEEKILTEGNSKAINEEGVIITADKFIYDKLNNTVTAYNNVEVNNPVQNYLIFAEEIIYLPNDKKIYSLGKTKSVVKSKYTILSENVNFLINENSLSSKKDTILYDLNSNYYYLEEFNFDINNERLNGKNVLLITNFGLPKSDQIYFSNLFVDFKDKKFVGGKTTVKADKKIFDNQNQDPRLIGISSKGEGNKTIVNKGVFTSCDDNEKCPPWSISAKKITHDKSKRQLEYDNALLKIYNIPVLYFPKFFHPDPSVKRQSGFLRPQMNENSVLGSSLYLPYFKVISESKDITFRPRVYDNKIYMLQSEYRQENKNSSFIADFGYMYGYKSETEIDDKNSQVHFFSNFNKDLQLKKFSSSTLNASIYRVNNDHYLKIFDNSLSQTPLNPSNKNVLTSAVELTLDHEKYNFDAGITINETLTTKKSSDRFDYVPFYYNYDKGFEIAKLPGFFNFYSKGNNTLSNTNNLTSEVLNDINFQSNDYITKNGFKNNINIYYKNFNTIAKKHNTIKNSPTIRFDNIYEFVSSWPLNKSTINYDNTIIPKVSYRINPNSMNDVSGASRRVLYNNVFNINRLNINESFEDGQSLTLGANYIKESIQNSSTKFDYGIATVLRDEKSNKIPISSTINEKNSNIFGSFRNSFNKNFSLNFNFSIEDDLNTLNYNQITSTISVNNFVTTFNFIEENTDTSDVNTISNSTTYKFDDKNYFSFETRRNRKINLTEYYDLIYEYKNDCLTAGIKFRKTYYRDNAIKPKEDLLLTLTLVPLTTYEHRVDSLDVNFD